MKNPQFINEKILYTAYSQDDSICQIRIIPQADEVLVVCTELAENKGTSITNKATVLAQRVVEKYEIEPNKIRWIEHVVNPKPLPFENPNEYSVVTFKWTGHKFTSPQWETLPYQEFRSLLLEYCVRSNAVGIHPHEISMAFPEVP